jgi:predicted signal transduction protein with EAL and GGDEF domain
MIPLDTGDSDTLMRNADSAMYKAKARGGNRYAFYTANMTSRAMERLNLENSLRADPPDTESCTWPASSLSPKKPV